MKRYVQSLWTWVDAAIVSIAFAAFFSTFWYPFYSALAGLALGILSAYLIACIFASQNKKFDPIVEKYAKNNVVINEPIKVIGIRGMSASLPARLVLTHDGELMILLANEGYKFTLGEDHSFIYISGEKRILLAKNGCDVQIASGVMLNNLGYISLAIADKGFRMERREHAPY